MAIIDGIAAYWPLDGDSTDSVGSFDGTDTSLGYIQAKIQRGGDYNGTTSKTLIANTIPTMTAFSVAAWVRPDATLTEKKFFCRDWNGGTDWGIMMGQNGASQFDCGVKTTVNWRSVNDPATYSGGTTYHVAATYDGTTLSLYKNGAVVASTAPAEAMENMASKEIRIGCLNTTTQLVNAVIDDVGFWSRALTFNEVTLLYNRGSGFPFPFHDRGFVLNNLRPSVFAPGLAR